MPIIMRATLAALLLFMASSPAWGEQRSGTPKIPPHTPEWTDHNESDPGISTVEPASQPLSGVASSPETGIDSVVDELQGIVVLCATKPQSAEFDRAWAGYLQRHYKPGMNVDRLINDVLTRAETHVRFGDGRRGARQRTSFNRGRTRQRMRGVADRVIVEMR